jgi:hypothetical protein
MENFRLPGKLKQTFFDAITNKRFWPSYPKYIQAHVEASPICKDTARGHPIEEFRDVNRWFVYEVLNEAQREELVFNMRQHLGNSSPKRKDSLINIFLDNNFYCPCSNEKFLKSIWLSLNNSTPERKKVAFEKFLYHIHRIFVSYYWENVVDQRKISVGFSDDLKVNILGMKNHIINDLKQKFPEIKFSLYDTSDPWNIDKEIIK